MSNWGSGSLLERADEEREQPGWVEQQWHDDALLLQVGERGMLPITDDALRFQPVRGDYDPHRHFLLGIRDQVPIFAEEVAVDGAAEPLILIGKNLSEVDLEVATVATALLTWHRAEQHCGRCGASTEAQRGGFSRYCAACHSDHFPRHDPAVIVAVVDDDDRLLLGHHVDWDEYRMSLLAGFVAVGETFEDAVHRELAEEAKLTLDAMRYVGSQPWPFPRSLMVGFVAHAVTPDFQVDGREIIHAEWFSREEMNARLAEGTLKMPGSWSISNRIIEDWRAGRLPDPRS
ncbi:NAD(+) diphosphatase [Enemella sp. A6]|uniref:NAD(+) diphosphatase n=1 Tax=Enemella sp. A6 TaxID=3440152 RepID=UPI003EBD63B6